MLGTRETAHPLFRGERNENGAFRPERPASKNR